MSSVTQAIDFVGLTPIARRLGFRPSAIQKWQKNGRLPRTELAGLTHYAAVLEELSGGKFTADILLADTRSRWRRRVAYQTRAKAQRAVPFGA